ncbi:HAD-IIA family hydrolase [Candidatus Micrarchaeota archaeon]|nr:HAD-IIA family hydrolase [Candidatus Micrarchaeota archaeon]
MAKLGAKKGFIFDLDGVIYLGETVIEGAAGAIELLRKQGKKIMFMTNNSTNSRVGFCKKLSRMGIRVNVDEVLTSSHATAIWLKNNYHEGRVLVVGERGLREELRDTGFEIKGVNVDFVVVGLDRKFDYEKLKSACFALQKGAVFISTNQDATYPTEKGILPGGGAMVSALETCSGRKVFVDIGKPNRYMLDIALKEMRLKEGEVVFIGDRVDTDVAMAKKVGVVSVLVLSGITKRGELKKLTSALKPDFILNSVNELKSLV